MFEFYGWARVESTSGQRIWRNDGLYRPDDTKVREELAAKISKFHSHDQAHIHLVDTVSGLTSVSVFGLRNHRVRAIFELYEWLAKNAKRSRGVLFISDVEDGLSYCRDDQYRVFRLANGRFDELPKLFEMPPVPPPPPAIDEFEYHVSSGVSG